MRPAHRSPQPVRTDRGRAALLLTSILSALLGGAALGAVVGPVGVALGLVLGLGFGMLAGKGMVKDDRARAERTRELDDIIGITRGSLGADASSLVPPPPEGPADGERWLAEWLTPPPPTVTG
jgi:hypothetical protein